MRTGDVVGLVLIGVVVVGGGAYLLTRRQVNAQAPAQTGQTLPVTATAGQGFQANGNLPTGGDATANTVLGFVNAGVGLFGSLVNSGLFNGTN